MEALQLLKDYADKPRKEPYGADVNVPLEGVPNWQEAVMSTSANGDLQLDRVYL